YQNYLALVTADQAARRQAAAENIEAAKLPLYYRQQAATEANQAAQQDQRERELNYLQDFQERQLQQQADLKREDIAANRLNRQDLLAERDQRASDSLFERLFQQINRGDFDSVAALKAAGADDPRITGEQFGSLLTTLGQHQKRMQEAYQGAA